MSEQNYCVAVIGAGPAGLFGARELANQVFGWRSLTVILNPADWRSTAFTLKSI
ncbi:hypothetical protein [Candidatus Villigracilis saccharophilus]|uniref:hypothetical protein n=1 Tax=Candidatus Villigracilis saccharophilus TaxID=3140684 RepID=UPI003136B4D1|nr:hypothetical protein [Anaerolineales bacterium]